MSMPWKTCVAALGVLRRIRAKVAELGGDGVEVGCAHLGVPELMLSAAGRRHKPYLAVGADRDLVVRSGRRNGVVLPVRAERAHERGTVRRGHVLRNAIHHPGGPGPR